LGGAWLSNKHVDFIQGLQPTGTGRTHDVDLALDSRLGAQLSIAAASGTLITAQTVVERLSDNEFQPRLTLLNIRQEIGKDFAIRVGRIQSPVFLASSYRLANFSNPWARTPGVVYGLYPLIHLDSVDLSYQHETQIGTFGLNGGYGMLEQPLPGKARGELNAVAYANLKLDKDPWHFKLSWLHGRAEIESAEFDRFVAGLALIDPKISKNLDIRDLDIGLYAAGFSYDDANWLVMGEWGLLRSDDPSLLPERHGAYLTVGYHLDRWLPQITLGYQASTGRRLQGKNSLSEAILADLHKQARTDYHTLAVGLNYAVTDTVMLRGQVDIINPLKNSLGPYAQTDAHYKFRNPGTDVLISLTLDFVY
jgi:predicted porin